MTKTRTSLRFRNSGTTLVELMIAVTVLTIISLGFAGAFANISKAFQFSKTRTLAYNLAQEQIQILKQKAFNRILVTTATLTHPDLNFPYDNGYYPPESIIEGGINFTRYTYIQVVTENSGDLNYFGAIPDTGMKAVKVAVTWNQGNEYKKVDVRSLVSNMDTTMTNAIFNGQVTAQGTGAAINGAVVNMAENVGYVDNTNATGNFTINISPGNYTMTVSARGYFSTSRTVSIAANSTQAQNFSLIPMSSGTVVGSVWINDHPVISQVVASTQNAVGFCQEFVEVFNPSTSTVQVFAGGTTSLDVEYQRYGQAMPTTILMDYTATQIDPGHYYLFANTTPVVMNGVSRNADAVYRNTNMGFPDLIPSAGGGACSAGGDADGVQIKNPLTGQVLDTLGWSRNSVGHPDSPIREGTAIVQNIGFQDGEQYIRRSSTSGATAGVGRAYDTGNNNVDFVNTVAGIYQRNTSDIEPVVSGVPAYGAYVSASDGLSQTTNALQTGNPPFASFSLVSVATGIWSVFIVTNSLSLDITTVTVAANSSVYVPNLTTTPAWPLANYYAAILSEVATSGYIAGWAKDAFNNPISVPLAIRITAGGAYTDASVSNGSYFLPVPPGNFDVIANDTNRNSFYVSKTSAAVDVNLGQVTSNVNFTLTQGGRIRGNTTRDGINALPGIAIVAFNDDEVASDQEVSGSDGRFTLINLATGAYRVEPVLGSGEVSSPESQNATVTAGSLIVLSTFTITGSFGSIRGTVSDGANPIRTGVLIVCSTATVGSTPPTLSQATLTGSAYYAANSYEDGTFAFEVRGSTTTTYKITAYYPRVSGETITVSTRTVTNISVTAGLATSGVTIAW